MAFINYILASVSQFALYVIGESGYVGIFILSFLESAAIPIPSEVVLPFSGFLILQGKFTLLGVVLTATLANLGGSILLYWIGKSGGRWVLERYGRFVLITHHELKIGDEWFLKHGVKAIFWGRMLPVIRTFISLPAGVTRMNFWRFCAFTFLGALPWNFALVYVGVKTGEHWNILHEYFQRFNYVIVGVGLVFVIWYIWHYFRKHRHD
ncbi:MAG: DedA family protein [Bacteroidia bacterium]|nr:DedA family protein [Bacteroidia bacterium]